MRDLFSLNKILNGFGKWVISFLLVILTYQLGYTVQQSDFSQILTYYIPFFLLYVLIFIGVSQSFKGKKEGFSIPSTLNWSISKPILFFLLLGIFLRGILVFSLPNLSDDIYRFIWDGRLILNGVNPFDQLPKYYIENDVQLAGITPQLFAKINSPEYFTIYPPVAQFTFAFSCWLFPNSILGSSIVMKLFLFAFEIGSLILIIKILRHFRLPQKNVLLYALNPLIIVEITGNLHFEGGMIFFFLLSVWFILSPLPSKTSILPEKRIIFSAVAMGLSIASKLLPLIFLPFLIKRLGWKKSLQYFSIIGLTLIVLFSPLISDVFINNFGKSLNLYFQKFEFNASLYYALRWVGYQIKGFNLIHVLGPVLAMITFSGILTMAYLERDISWRSLFQKCFWAICLYLFCTTTVHPWYVSLPIVLCLFTNFRFPILWSGFVMLTYINYSYNPYFENLWVVCIEYIAVLGLLIFEVFRNKNLGKVH